MLYASLAGHELAGGDVQERDTAHTLAEVHGREEVVLLARKHIVLHGHTRCYKFRDATLHQFLGKFRVLQLVANGHPLPCSHQSWQIGVKGMEGESCHLQLSATSGTIVSACQRYAQYARSHHGIFAVGLVEVTTPEQQHALWVLCLQVVELFHHRGERLLCHICLCFFVKSIVMDNWCKGTNSINTKQGLTQNIRQCGCTHKKERRFSRTKRPSHHD